MHNIEPYYFWRDLYIAAEDELSPFYQYFNSEIEYTHAIYNHIIHPQWDSIGSPTLFIKVLFVDYEMGYSVIELMGEWNDCTHNDIMFLKRDIIDLMIKEGINKYILIGENILIFHPDSDDYYSEWFDDIEDGWIAAINFRKHVLDDFSKANLDYYINFGNQLNNINWTAYQPQQLFDLVSNYLTKRLG
ncbi:MAG: hypothetical protein WCK02_00365 [Bacteroidota bacterium]